MSAVAEKLIEARKLIECGWAQGEYARSATGRAVFFNSPAAASWCATGAIWRVANYEACRRMWRLVADVTGCDNLVKFNDAPERTQSEVLAAFDKAIELARQEDGQ